MGYVVVDMQNGYVENRAWPYEQKEDAEERFLAAASEAVKSPIATHTVMLMTDEGFLCEPPRCYHHAVAPAVTEGA